jgi:hypothetical protein
VVHLSATQWIVYGALSVVWAFLGYRLSENDRKVLGRTPWGLPSALWAFFWFLSLLVGLILFLIAHSTGVRQSQQNPPMAGTSMGAPPGPPAIRTRGPASASELFPAYPRPANVQSPWTESEPEQAEQSQPTDRQTEGAPGPNAPLAAGQDRLQSPPAWHPDPSGRFHYRWWDGSQWTSQVSTDGHHLIDTNPDQRIGPY